MVDIGAGTDYDDRASGHEALEDNRPYPQVSETGAVEIMSFGQSDITCTIMSCCTIRTDIPPYLPPTPTNHIINLHNASGLLAICANFGIGASFLGLLEPQGWLKREGHLSSFLPISK